MSIISIGTWAGVDDNDVTSGRNTLKVSCDGGYKGRLKRAGVITISTESKSRNVNVAQAGQPEYLKITTVGTPTAAANTINVEGVTNASKLTFKTKDTIATIASNYTVSYGLKTLTVNNGAAITDDPGASQEVGFSIQISFTANTSPKPRNFRLYVNTGSGIGEYVDIKQVGEAYYIYFDEAGNPTTKTITFDCNGMTGGLDYANVDVVSNDDYLMAFEPNTWFAIRKRTINALTSSIKIYNVDQYTGRSNRASYSLNLATVHGASATLTISQTAKQAFIGELHIEDESGNKVRALGADVEKYYIVGKSNCPLLSVQDTTTTACTSLNDSGAIPHTGGFTLIDGDDLQHDAIALDTNISPDYGATAEYTFKLPFYTLANSDDSDRTVSIQVYYTAGSLSQTIQITQVAVAGDEEDVEEDDNNDV